MINVKAEKLTSPQFLKQLEREVDDIIMRADRFRDAYDLAKILQQALVANKELAGQRRDLYKTYKVIIVKLRWAGLQIMPERDMPDMFRYHFVEIFSLPDYADYYLWEKLKTVLLYIPILPERDGLKRTIRKTLESNGQKITSAAIIINNVEKTPTVAHWIQDYISTVGGNKADDLKRTEYLTNSINLKKLPMEEKQKVKALLDFYERLKLSSETLKGFEDDIPLDDPDRRGVVKQGVFEPYKDPMGDEALFLQIARETIGEIELAEMKKSESVTPEEKKGQRIDNISLDNLHKMANEYPIGSLERRAVEEEIKKISNS